MQKKSRCSGSFSGNRVFQEMKKKIKRGTKRRKFTKANTLAGKYSECFSFIKSSKNYILAVILLFLAAALAGIAFPNPFREQIYQILRELILQIQGFNFLQLSIYIIKNNIMSCLVAMCLGIFLGIAPVITTMFNGYILGFVASESAKTDGLLVLWKLFPHGIFELPAVFISMGISLRLGLSIFTSKSKKQFLKDLAATLYTFLLVAIPLLIIAGFIEAALMILIK